MHIPTQTLTFLQWNGHSAVNEFLVIRYNFWSTSKSSFENYDIWYNNTGKYYTKYRNDCWW